MDCDLINLFNLRKWPGFNLIDLFNLPDFVISNCDLINAFYLILPTFLIETVI